ncbi:hypothetical protein JNJ66_03840 [Candidatus Saccharibacteria bacterium]|nr:hypothetical protein [Candidatus Saccharibacteria bacterium]
MDTFRINEILRDCMGNVDDNQQALPGPVVVDVWQLVVLQPERVRAHAAEMVLSIRERWKGSTAMMNAPGSWWAWAGSAMMATGPGSDAKASVRGMGCAAAHSFLIFIMIK